MWEQCTLKNAPLFPVLVDVYIFQTGSASDPHCFSITEGLTRQINEKRPLEILQLLLWPTRPNWMVHECFTE